MERQWHGFKFQDYVKEKYGVNLSTEYTGKWDGKWCNYPVSIKHIKKGNAVDLADVFRQASISEDFFMFVDFYETETVSESDELYILFIPAKSWNSYFMPLDKFEAKFKDVLKSVTNDKKDDNKWKALREECVKYWKQNTTGHITLNGKRDHKTQKRWQCSINQTNFKKEFIPKYRITEEEFYAKRN